ncbi:hypothetical protein [Bacillus cihuensis]|nr:hypothetical protein [Bacillus cihuensis]
MNKDVFTLLGGFLAALLFSLGQLVLSLTGLLKQALMHLCL